MNLKRDLVKYVRDKAKSGYKKETQCYICETWLKKNKLVINSADEIMELRVTFIKEYNNEIYYEATTLCKPHHMRLHSIYGKRPKLVTALKQKRWVDKMRIKHGMV